MLLEKWYLDAVFPDGTVWFGYQARLRFLGCPSISWASGCEVFRNKPGRKVSCWKRVPEPRLESGQWQWKGPDGFHARWDPSGPASEKLLASEKHLQVRWNCVAPKALVTRTHGGAVAHRSGTSTTSQGIGYIEHLQIGSTRSDLPFRQLWWGRAHAGASSLVWIRWGGGRDLSLLIEDGVQVTGQFETFPGGGVRIQTAKGQWETGNGQPLCDRDVRRSFPRWLVWLTREMAPMRELKLAGPVRLRTSSGEVTGSGVWEEVKWA